MSWLDPHEWAPLDGKSDWRDDPANAWCKVCDRGLEGCTHHPADSVQGDAKLRGNSGDADATENHKNGRSER